MKGIKRELNYLDNAIIKSRVQVKKVKYFNAELKKEAFKILEAQNLRLYNDRFSNIIDQKIYSIFNMVLNLDVYSERFAHA